MVKAGEIGEGFDCLRRTLNVYRIWPVVIVAGASRRSKEFRLEVSEPAIQLRLESLIARALDVTFEAIQIVSSMKVVNPALVRVLSVIPAAVGQLSRTTVLHGRPVHPEQFLLLGMFRCAGKHCRSQHIGVVYGLDGFGQVT